MTITKLFPSGAYQVSDIVNGYLFKRVYFGYTKKEAKAAFKTESKLYFS